MAKTFEELEVGSVVFIGSRWHVVHAKKPADPQDSYYRYHKDRVATNCNRWSGYYVTPDILNTTSKDPAPKCKTCFSGYGRYAIPLSSVSDPDVREKIQATIAKGIRPRWLFYVDAPQ